MAPGQTMMTQGMQGQVQQQPGWQGGNIPPGMVHVQRSAAPGGPQVRPAMMGGFQPGQQQMIQRIPGQQMARPGKPITMAPGQQIPQQVLQQRMALQQQQQQMMQQRMGQSGQIIQQQGIRQGMMVQQGGGVIQVQQNIPGQPTQIRMMSPQNQNTGSPSASQSPQHISGQPSPAMVQSPHNAQNSPLSMQNQLSQSMSPHMSPHMSQSMSGQPSPGSFSVTSPGPMGQIQRPASMTSPMLPTTSPLPSPSPMYPPSNSPHPSQSPQPSMSPSPAGHHGYASQSPHPHLQSPSPMYPPSN